METIPRGSVNLEDSDQVSEQRAKPRIAAPFRTTVQGIDAMGVAFEENTVLDNLSSDGLYLRLRRQLLVGAKLSFFIQMSVTPAEDESMRNVVAEGRVLRADALSNGAYGVAVSFISRRFL